MKKLYVKPTAGIVTLPGERLLDAALVVGSRGVNEDEVLGKRRGMSWDDDEDCEPEPDPWHSKPFEEYYDQKQ